MKQLAKNIGNALVIIMFGFGVAFIWLHLVPPYVFCPDCTIEAVQTETRVIMRKDGVLIWKYTAKPGWDFWKIEGDSVWLWRERCE